MARTASLISFAALLAGSISGVVPVQSRAEGSAVSVQAAAPEEAGVPLPAFVSFSIEFSSFPDFAGNLSVPNTFSNNLLNNLGNLAGSKPIIRVGGNTQDYA